MATARAKGRPIAPLELSAEQRAYLQRQVRRHCVARSLSERSASFCGNPSARRSGAICHPYARAG